jgi:hypothetical protein
MLRLQALATVQGLASPYAVGYALSLGPPVSNLMGVCRAWYSHLFVSPLCAESVHRSIGPPWSCQTRAAQSRTMSRLPHRASILQASGWPVSSRTLQGDGTVPQWHRAKSVLSLPCSRGNISSAENTGRELKIGQNSFIVLFFPAHYEAVDLLQLEPNVNFKMVDPTQTTLIHALRL